MVRRMKKRAKLNAVLRDSQIRPVLLQELRSVFPSEDDDLILQEFGCNAARIDVAVVNGALHGFEIKSDRDSLDRLSTQVAEYGRVFDFVTLVVGRKLLDHAKAAIPEWWGITLATTAVDSCVVLRRVRNPKGNPAREAAALAQMLWKDEALRCLRRFGHHTVTSRNRAAEVWEEASRLIDIDTLAEEARNTIRARGGSGFQKQPSQYGDLYSTESIALASHWSANLEWLLSQRSRNRPG
jgi:hypothetical protein